MNDIQIYQPRKIEFERLAVIDDWNIKVYTITPRREFESKIALENAIAKLPKWLEKSKTLGFETYRSAFLIVHEGRDGIWSLVNWWLGGNMLHSKTFYTDFKNPDEFRSLPSEGFMACVWEMPVIGFEREMWIEFVLKKAEKPDFKGYLTQHLSREV